MAYRISFGSLRIGQLAREKIDAALNRNWVSEGENTREFERRFAEKFQWKHAIATSSGTDAGIVVWSAVRELTKKFNHAALEEEGYYQPGPIFGKIITPACAFVATANCLLAAGLKPHFVDVNLETLNMNPGEIQKALESYRQIQDDIAGIQFVANLGKPTPLKEIAAIAEVHDLYLIGDFCEGHGAGFIIDESEKLGAPGPNFFNRFKYADHFCDAAIYSFFAAHMIVAGEGGMICTDDDEIAALCRSIKCHGYGDGPRFDFARFGINAKMNELTAAVGLEGLEKFDETFCVRRENRAKLMSRLCKFEDKLILYPDGSGEIIAPHAFPIVLRDSEADVMPLYHHLEAAGIECKTLFGSLPNHGAFKFLGYKLGDFPVAERIGKTGFHFSCSEYLTDADIDYIAERVGEGLEKFC